MQHIKITILKIESCIQFRCCLPGAVVLIFMLQACSVSRQINKQAKDLLLIDSVISTGHIGISIYEPATNKYWYNYNADKYFVPASNTKLFSLYAGMKYLGDSLVGARYVYSDTQKVKDRLLVIVPSGDPTFLHRDFKHQPVFDFLKKDSGFYSSICIYDSVWKDEALGMGWSWDDYNEPYMTERSSFPIFGGTIDVELKTLEERKKIYSAPGISESFPENIHPFNVTPAYFDSLFTQGTIGMNTSLMFNPAATVKKNKEVLPEVKIIRRLQENNFIMKGATNGFSSQTLPLVWLPYNQVQVDFLAKRFNKLPFIVKNYSTDSSGTNIQLECSSGIGRTLKLNPLNIIHSQPSDSLFKPMMYNSDNFFAEQTLLMASNEHLGFMNDEAIIDTLLKTDLKDIPQKPRWVDGSGLSRYNLFTPQSFVYLLNKMKNDFGMERLSRILPTGGTGTFSNYYLTDSSFIYAKTGSLSGIIALSGYLTTKKNKLLVFSILNNNFRGRATLVRRAVEKFIQQLRQKY